MEVKDYIQSNTLHISCQRGCTAVPFSHAPPPHFPLFLCWCQPKEKKPSSLLSYIKMLSNSSSLTLTLSLLLSAQFDPLPVNCLCLSLSREIIFLLCLEGSKLTVDESGQKRLCSGPSPLHARPRTSSDIYTSPLSLSPARQKPTCLSRGGSVCVCMYISM